MASSLGKHPTALKFIEDLEEEHENKYDTLSSKVWDGDSFIGLSDKALLLNLSVEPYGKHKEHWFPFSHMRKDAQGTVYFSNWILEQKGLL